MKKILWKHKNIAVIFIAIAVFATILARAPEITMAAVSLKSPFGGKISVKPALIVTTKKELCTSGATCAGTVSNTWVDNTAVTCSQGTFSLVPNLPSGQVSNNYCAEPSADNKTISRTVGVSRWILGLFAPKKTAIPTLIGTCVCVSSPPVPPVTVTTPVEVEMLHVKMFGLSNPGI